MQFAITDDAAIIFAREYYRAIADGYPVDAAFGEARKAVYLDDNEMEWATPVLFMRAPDGALWDMADEADDEEMLWMGEKKGRGGMPSPLRREGI
jgi:hypothetical protein